MGPEGVGPAHPVGSGGPQQADGREGNDAGRKLMGGVYSLAKPERVLVVGTEHQNCKEKASFKKKLNRDRLVCLARV